MFINFNNFNHVCWRITLIIISLFFHKLFPCAHKVLIQSKWFFICMYTVSRSPATWMLSMHFLHWWSENILDLSVQVLAFLIQFNSTHSFFTYIFLFNSNKHVFFLVCSLRVQSLCSAFQNYCRFAIGCPGLIVSKIYLVHVLSSLWKQAFKYGICLFFLATITSIK